MTFSKRKKKTLAKNLSANLISQRFGTYAVAAPNQVNSRRKQHFQKVLPWEHYALHLPQKVSMMTHQQVLFQTFQLLSAESIIPTQEESLMGEGEKVIILWRVNPVWTGHGGQNGPLRVFAKYFKNRLADLNETL